MNAKVFLLTLVFACYGQHGCYGQYFRYQAMKRDRTSSPQRSFRYFSLLNNGLSPGWYRSKEDYWKLHNKRYFYQSLEEAIENGMPVPTMPTMDTMPTMPAMDTGFPTPDTMDTDPFSMETNFPSMSQEPPTAFPQQTPYMPPYPIPVQMEQAPIAFPPQTPMGVALQTPYQTNSVQTQYQQGILQAPMEPRPQPVTSLPQYRPIPVQTTPVVSPLPQQQKQQLASFPSMSSKAKFERHNSSRICAPGPPLKAHPTLKNCLLIGDSITLGYFWTVKFLLNDMCQVQHAPYARGSGAVDSKHGVDCLSMLLKTTSLQPTHYDAIIFNFGMHDIDYSKTFPEERVSHQEYKKNLKILKDGFLKTGAKVAFALTTPYMSSQNRNKRIKQYNKIAVSVMRSGPGVPVIDTYHIITKRCGQPANNKNCSILKRPGDVHFNEEGYQILGVRVAATFATMINQTLPIKHSAVKGRRRFFKTQLPSFLDGITCPDAFTRCPVGTTCCKSFLSLTGYGCCMIPDAVSCDDNWHCCSSGSICSPTCTARECHCIKFVESKTGKLIEKKTKAKTRYHAHGTITKLKKKVKTTSHPLVRLLKKWKKQRKTKSHGKGKSPPDLSKKLKKLLEKKKKQEKNVKLVHAAKTTNRSIDVELSQLIKHHHKKDYKELKDYLKDNTANHSTTRNNNSSRASTNQQVHYADTSADDSSTGSSGQLLISDKHDADTSADDSSTGSSGQLLINDKHDADTSADDSSTGSSGQLLISDKHFSLAGNKQGHFATVEYSGEGNILLHNTHQNMYTDSTDEYVTSSGGHDNEMEPLDDIEGNNGSGMHDLIEPVSPPVKDIKTTTRAENTHLSAKTESQGHKRNHLKAHPLTHIDDDIDDDDDLMSRNLATNKDSHAFDDWFGDNNRSVKHENTELFDEDAEDVLSSEFKEANNDHGFDLMISASSSTPKDAASIDKKTRKPPEHHGTLMNMNKESWEGGESGSGFKEYNDVTFSFASSEDDVMSTNHDRHHSHDASAHISKEFNSELVALGDLERQLSSSGNESVDDLNLDSINKTNGTDDTNRAYAEPSLKNANDYTNQTANEKKEYIPLNIDNSNIALKSAEIKVKNHTNDSNQSQGLGSDLTKKDYNLRPHANYPEAPIKEFEKSTPVAHLNHESILQSKLTDPKHPSKNKQFSNYNLSTNKLINQTNTSNSGNIEMKSNRNTGVPLRDQVHLTGNTSVTTKKINNNVNTSSASHNSNLKSINNVSVAKTPLQKDHQIQSDQSQLSTSRRNLSPHKNEALAHFVNEPVDFHLGLIVHQHDRPTNSILQHVKKVIKPIQNTNKQLATGSSSRNITYHQYDKVNINEQPTDVRMKYRRKQTAQIPPHLFNVFDNHKDGSVLQSTVANNSQNEQRAQQLTFRNQTQSRTHIASKRFPINNRNNKDILNSKLQSSRSSTGKEINRDISNKDHRFFGETDDITNLNKTEFESSSSSIEESYNGDIEE